METGGVLSHGAIVAREFGLPAVAGLPGVTSRLKTGQRIHVDGASGTVTVIDGKLEQGMEKPDILGSAVNVWVVLNISGGGPAGER
ncbi:MAG: PEP-utilizing enzyme [Gemmataceae bacterium]